MLFRFSLYGFLKNQQYYDPFFILAFLDKGLSFTMIGFLIGFREICINILEVPTGAVADIVGRRRSMIFSFLSYIIAFLIFGVCYQLWLLFLGMFFFSIGEAFRTGTHKAIIFSWLEHENRGHDRTRIYGFTRSWSKIGSAVSVVVSVVLVFTLNSYSVIFLFSILPYVINILNFISYPEYLDGRRKEKISVYAVFHTLVQTLKESWKNRPLRRLLFESMGYEGSHKVCKDYLQPLLKVIALAMPVFLVLEDRQRTAMLVGAVYLVLYLLSSFASRYAGLLTKKLGSAERSSNCLWIVNIIIFGAMCAGILSGFPGVTIIAFVALTILQNFWRPIMISRIAAHADSKSMATVLSLESQAKSLFAALFAPITGLAVDLMPKFSFYASTLLDVEPSALSDWRFMPVALLGLFVALSMVATSKR